MNLEVYGISEEWLKIVLTFAVGVIPSLLVLIVTLRAGQSVVSAGKGVLRAIREQIDEPAEQVALANLLHTNPGLIDVISHFMQGLEQVKSVPAGPVAPVAEVNIGGAPQ